MVERNTELEYRMYFLNNFYFMGIQSGIQALHSAVRYVFNMHKELDLEDWVLNDETVIVLNGGFTNDEEFTKDTSNTLWSMNYSLKVFQERGIPHAPFREKMANNCLSSIALLVNEKIWNKKKYPDLIFWNKDTPGEVKMIYYTQELGLTDNEAFLRIYLGGFDLAK